jgi:toxin secretion/phage lysis holin
MEKTINIVKVIITAVIGSLATALGGFDKLMILFIWLACFDVLFGTAKGFKQKNFSSSLLFWGLVNKAVGFAIIALMVMVDNAIGKVGLLRNLFTIWFCLCNGASIIENTAAIGVPWPDWMVGAMVQVKKGFSINLGKIVQKIIDDYVKVDKEGKIDE